MGTKGLTALEHYFDRVNFKGKGYEEHNLNVLMKTYEYWCHRLFPKYPLDACIARLETLGTKRATITHIKKIRMGIANEDEDKLPDSDEDLLQETSDSGFVNTVNDQFDQLLPETFQTEISTTNKLTEEQLDQICRNKERAEQIRRERLQKIRERSTNLLLTTQQLEGNISSCSPTNTQVDSYQNLNTEVGINETLDDINLDAAETSQRMCNKSVIEITDGGDGEVHKINTNQQKSGHNQSQIINLTKDQMERIRQNKERAEKIRKEKVETLKNCLTQKGHDNNNDNFNTSLTKSVENNDCNINSDAIQIEDNGCKSNSKILEMEKSCNVESFYAGDTTNKNNICDDKMSHNHKAILENKLNSDSENDEVDLDQILTIINVENQNNDKDY